MRTAPGDARKIAVEIAWRRLSGGTLPRTPLIKNERAVDATDNPWDDGELASPRRGEARRIGELCSFKIYSFYPPPCEKAYP